MRFTVVVMIFIFSSFVVAQSSDNDVNNSAHNKSQQADSNATLGHKKAFKPDANQINVIIKKNQIVEEYRHKGELIMVKVIPVDGVPYYIDPQAKNKRSGAHSDLINSGVEPVHWVIKRF